MRWWASHFSFAGHSSSQSVTGIPFFRKSRYYSYRATLSCSHFLPYGIWSYSWRRKSVSISPPFSSIHTHATTGSASVPMGKKTRRYSIDFPSDVSFLSLGMGTLAPWQNLRSFRQSSFLRSTFWQMRSLQREQSIAQSIHQSDSNAWRPSWASFLRTCLGKLRQHSSSNFEPHR